MAEQHDTITLERLAYRPAEVGKLVGLSASEVRQMCHSGVLRHRRRGRAIIIPREAVQEWLNGQTSGHRNGLHILE